MLHISSRIPSWAHKRHRPCWVKSGDRTMVRQKSSTSRWRHWCRLTDQIINIVKIKLEAISEPWENVDLFKILSAERECLGLSVKVFMKALRYALTGMKVGLFRLHVFCFVLFTIMFSIRMDLVWQLLWKLLDEKRLSNDWNSCYPKSVGLWMVYFLSHQDSNSLK